MRSWVISILVLVWPALGLAQDARLQRLETTEAGRAWEAVGRLDFNGTGFCTGALIAPDLVLTAAHCLFDRASGRRIDHGSVEFLAGWRNGRASAYRQIRRAVVHPDYEYEGHVSSDRVRDDLALLELQRPIRNTTIVPFATARSPRSGSDVGVVSYARGRAESPALQEVCRVLSRQQGVMVMTCDVDFGASGAPVFSFDGGTPRIVSVVSAKAEVNGTKVALGTSLGAPLALLRGELAAGKGFSNAPAPRISRIAPDQARHETGARFIRP